MARTLPKDLATIALDDGTIVVKVLREMIFYKSDFTVDEYDALIDLYKSYCPANRDRLFRIPELPSWSQTAAPRLTMSARQKHGKPLAEFEAVRRRISEGRWFFTKLWDGMEIDEPDGSWSLDIQRRRGEDRTWLGYVRFLFPLDLPDATHVSLARDVVDTIQFISGHGGLCFTYVPERKSPAFDRIYALARRLKGVDVEDLPITLPHMRTELKPPCWLNAIGRGSIWSKDLWRSLCSLDERSTAQVTEGRFGLLIQLSESPELFDVNYRELPPQSYRDFDAAISEVRLSDIGAFSGAKFGADPEATNQWLSRFSSAQQS